jgi:hypothetical protein
VRIVKDQLIIVLEAIRVAQGALKDGRNCSVTVELLRDIICNSKVTGALRALSYDAISPPTASEAELFPRFFAAS